jgi:superfamily II DNA or RNA helicase
MSNYKMSRLENLKRSNYVDLKTNGRLLPSWLLNNFKKYRLPEIIQKEGVDPCEVKDSKRELRLYQRFISQYLDFKSNMKNMLVYHGMGSGKTATAINVYNVLYNYTPGWNVFILLKASLKGTWLTDIERWLRKDEYEFRYKNIIFIHYDSPFADRDFMDALKNVDSSKKSIYIIDEVHNFIRNVYSNINSTSGKRAQVIYDYIIQNRREDSDTRVVLLSATPAINKPFELALLFNLLREDSFPKSESEFNHLFITEAHYQSLNKNNKNLFQRRILGLVSFYIGATPDLYASKTLHYIDVPMSEPQQDIYNHYEAIEIEIDRRAKMTGKDKSGSSTYKSYTRQSSNFTFPQISQRVNGETRPRPNKFRISERDAIKLLETTASTSTLKVQKGTDKVMKVTEYIDALDAFIMSFDKYLFEIDSKDRDVKHTILTDFETYRDKYSGVFEDFHNSKEKKSGLYKAMHESSGKMLYIIFTVMRSPGPCLVYSNYVQMEGLQIFKVYLKYFGFYSFMIDKKLKPDKVGYVEFHGGIKSRDDRKLGLKEINKTENKLGNFIKIILISPAGSEGLNLRNIRQVHIMEPYWNEVRINQMIGRAVRQCSHSDLSMDQRTVDIYRYKSVRAKVGKWTTDQYIEDLARSKDGLIQSFLDSVKEAAVDCVLNKKHNMMAHEYKCFQFEEPSLFDKNIGPAYKENIYDDMKIDNGSNSTKATTMKIKVMQIKAVKKLSPPGDEDVKYSKISDYWYYANSGTVYDFDLHFAIGKVELDDNSIPTKLDVETYIIDRIVPIPVLND